MPEPDDVAVGAIAATYSYVVGGGPAAGPTLVEVPFTGLDDDFALPNFAGPRFGQIRTNSDKRTKSPLLRLVNCGLRCLGLAPRLRRLLSQAFLLFQFHHSELMPQLCRGRSGVYAAHAFSGPTSPLCFSFFFSNRAQLCFVFNRDFNDDFLPRTHHDDFGFLADLSL